MRDDSRLRGSNITSASAPGRKKKAANFAPSFEKPNFKPDEQGIYGIVWTKGELGLKLKANADAIPIISRLTGKGSAQGLQSASLGDELVSVNGDKVAGQEYKNTLRQLKHTPKPAILRFRPPVRKVQ